MTSPAGGGGTGGARADEVRDLARRMGLPNSASTARSREAIEALYDYATLLDAAEGLLRLYEKNDAAVYEDFSDWFDVWETAWERLRELVRP